MNFEEGIRRGFELFNRREWDRLARGFPDDFVAIDRVPPDELTVRGPDALRRITEANGDTAFAGLRMEAVEVRVADSGDGLTRVAVRVRAEASGGTSGVDLQGEIAQVWDFRAGVPVRMEQFRTWAEALAAARLTG